MNRSQASAIVAMVIGLSVMANATSHDTTAAGASSASPLLAFVFAILGMMSFAGAVLAIRIGCLGNLAAWSGFVVRMIVFLITGVVAVAYSVMTDGAPEITFAILAIPSTAGFVQAGGVLCV